MFRVRLTMKRNIALRWSAVWSMAWFYKHPAPTELARAFVAAPVRTVSLWWKNGGKHSPRRHIEHRGRIEIRKLGHYPS
jgi:hypothetical protein